MALDKGIAAVFFIVSLAYGYGAFTFHLLPFERHMSFLPNTLPTALSVIAGLLSLLIILTPSEAAAADGAEEDITLSKVMKDFEVGQALYLITAMILYALALRPIGFLASTSLFLIATGWILGERKLHIMIPIAIFSAVFIWYLVQETLGLFLRPLPWFLG